MEDIKMSDDVISYALQYLSGLDPEDIECDDFDIAANDDQFASFSIVRAAKLGHESIDRLAKENAQLKADMAELVKLLGSIPYDIADSFEWFEANDSYIDELLQKHKEPNNGN